MIESIDSFQEYARRVTQNLESFFIVLRLIENCTFCVQYAINVMFIERNEIYIS